MKVNFLNLARSKTARLVVVKVEGISYDGSTFSTFSVLHHFPSANVGFSEFDPLISMGCCLHCGGS